MIIIYTNKLLDNFASLHIFGRICQKRTLSGPGVKTMPRYSRIGFSCKYMLHLAPVKDDRGRPSDDRAPPGQFPMYEYSSISGVFISKK